MHTNPGGAMPMNPLDELEALLEVSGPTRSAPLAKLGESLSASRWLPTLVEIAALRWSRWRAGQGDLGDLLQPAASSRLGVLLRGGAELPLVALEVAPGRRLGAFQLLEGELIEVPLGDKGWSSGEPLALFEERFRNALRHRGYSSDGADLLMAALSEMEGNAFEHALAPIPPIACYQIHAKGWAFSVTDVGCGVLESLRRNPNYTKLTNAHDALGEALRPGVSCTGERGRGNGFATLFKALVDRNCWLRIRSSGVGGRWSGASPTHQTLERVILPERTGMHVAVGSVWTSNTAGA